MIDEARLAKTMKTLDLTREEVLEMWAEDGEVDAMTKASEWDNDLTAEQKKTIKKMRSTGTRQTGYKFDKKPKKLDDEKVNIIAQMAEKLAEIVENVEISNPQKEISFTLNGNSYSFSLIKHRPPKN